MKKNILSLLALILLTVAATFTAEAQIEKRISFAKGKSSATLRGSTGANGVTYVVRARSGQKIMIDLTPASRVGIKVESNGRDGHQVLLREENGGKYTIGLDESGDYTIFVGSLSGKPVAFALTVAIGKMADI